jgi:prephenate dehydrogenase
MSDDLISSARICIIGLGLMGGSLAMALRGKCGQLYAVDTDQGTRSFIKDHDLADRISATHGDLIPKSDVIILAVPVERIIEIINQLPAIHPGAPIVIDVGSTKREILMEYDRLPSRFDPIGGHPMCGKENLSIFNAEPSLFRDAPFALTPLTRTTEKAHKFAEQLAISIGAKPLWIDAETHDAWVAATSHLPFLISMSLAQSTPVEAKPLVGPGFRSAVRLASTPAAMMVDILRTNRDEILKSGSTYLKLFGEILRLLENSEFDLLAELIEVGRSKKGQLVGQNGH